MKRPVRSTEAGRNARGLVEVPDHQSSSRWENRDLAWHNFNSLTLFSFRRFDRKKHCISQEEMASQLFIKSFNYPPCPMNNLFFVPLKFLCQDAQHLQVPMAYSNITNWNLNFCWLAERPMTSALSAFLILTIVVAWSLNKFPFIFTSRR